MKIAVDLDDTYTKDPRRFDSIIGQLKSAGHEVGVITCRRQAQVAWADFLFCGNLAGLDIPPQIEYKTKIMKENNIALLFDDMARHYSDEVIVVDILEKI